MQADEEEQAEVEEHEERASSDSDTVRSESGTSASIYDEDAASSSEDMTSEEGCWTRADLFTRIIQECRHNAPGQCFSARVREQIERQVLHALTNSLFSQPPFIKSSAGVLVMLRMRGLVV